jgi:hypothetical protein
MLAPLKRVWMGFVPRSIRLRQQGVCQGSRWNLCRYFHRNARLLGMTRCANCSTLRQKLDAVVSQLVFSGQPNAMGGREVGGLANQLAAHMGFSAADIDRVRRFWKAPRMAPREGLKAVDMFEAIERGAIKALWVMATNPAVSLPRAGEFRAALNKLDLFVVSETTLRNDTVEAGAHVLLPAAAWGEKDGTVTNSERRVSRQRAFLRSPTGGSCPKSQAASASPRLSATAGRPIFFASTRRCRHSKMTGSATSTWAASPASPMQTTTCWIR